MKIVPKVMVILLVGLANPGFAQDCQATYYTTKGATIETTEYDANKTVKNKKVVTVSSVQKTNEGITAQYRSVKTEQNGTVSEDQVMTYRCNQGDVSVGLGVDDAKTKQEAIVTYPAIMKAGMALKPDVTFEQTGKTPDGKNARLTVKITDHKVVGSESITVPAGTWTCTKITYSLSMKIKVGIIGLPIDAQLTEWYHPQVGVVRNETWVKQKMEAYSELTALEQ